MQKNFVHNLKVWKFFRNNVLYKSKRINTPRTKGLNKFPESRRCAMGLNKSSLEIHSCVSKQWLMTSHDHSHNPELEELIVKKGGEGKRWEGRVKWNLRRWYCVSHAGTHKRKERNSLEFAIVRWKNFVQDGDGYVIG